MPSKKPPISGSKRGVKPKTKQQVRAAKMASAVDAVKNPGRYAASSKVKVKPYNVSEMRKRSKKKESSFIRTLGEEALAWNPSLWAVKAGVELLSGKDLSASRYKDGKFVGAPKKSRTSSLVDLAMIGAINKGGTVGKAIKKSRQTKNTADVLKTVKNTKVGRKQTTSTYHQKRKIKGSYYGR